jgi:Spy/CpxP family protein refolding chaperone
MLKQSSGVAIALLVAAFVAGGLVGAGVGGRGGPETLGAGPPFGRRGVHRLLKRELDLTPAQEDSVRAIFERHRPQMEALWRETRPRFDSLRAGVDSEIGAQLTPPQRARWQDMMRRMNDRLQRGPPTHDP